MAGDNKNELIREISTFPSKTGPSPSEFDVYVPWACNQLQVEVNVMMVRITQNEYVSLALTDRSKSRSKSKAKMGLSRTEVGSNDREDKSISVRRFQTFAPDDKVVLINTTYDNCDNLVQIKFNKNKNIPRTVLQLLGLIVKFHIYLTSLTINRGLDRYSIHEICKILPKSRITDVCLDGTYLEDANYYLLLEKSSCLRQLSLARCKISDEALMNIAKNLIYPLPASKTLAVLNIPTNRFSDVGVKYLAEALKSNRQLAYLNLADNMITDEGTTALLNTLMEFPLSCEELLQSRQRYVKYLNDKKDLVAKLVIDLKCSDEKRMMKKRAARPTSFPGKKAVKGLEKEISLKNIADGNKSFVNLDVAIYEKAENLAMGILGSFTDPYSTVNKITKDGVIYCFGNNTLSYINLSYTNISFCSVKKIMNVLLYQKQLDRKPRGLINLCIEGNAIPDSCKELSQIQDIIELGLMAHYRSYSGVKKRPPSRGK